MKSLTIGNSVTSIDECAFSDCTGLKSIYMQCIVPVECFSAGFSGKNFEEAVLYVPTGTLSAYKKVDPWLYFDNIREMDFSDVEETTVDGMESQIIVENGIIRISSAEREAYVEVFDIAGKNIYRGNDTTVSGLANGIYIVKVGATVKKIRL